MIVRIDESGRVLLPKPLVDRLELKADRELEVTETNEGLLLRPSRRRASLTKVDGLWIHQGAAPTGINWDRLLVNVRERRIRAALTTP